MNTYKPMNTEQGVLAGRDCIYLTEINYDVKIRNLTLKGVVNNYISDKTLLDKRFSEYSLTFTGVLALRITELDSWEEIMDDEYFKVESSFDEVLNSNWIKKLGGKVDSNHHHYLVQTYDDVFDIVCLSSEMTFLKEQNM